MQKGDTIKVVKRRLPQWYNCLVGLEGSVYDIDHTVQTHWEEKNGAEKKLKVRALNFGKPVIMQDGNEKQVFQWKPGDICTLYDEEVIKIKTVLIQQTNSTASMF
jgi:hypothetical protein